MRKLRVGLFLAVAAAASVGFVACGDDSNSDDDTTDNTNDTDADNTDMVMVDAAPPDMMVDAPTIDAMLPAIDDTCADNPAPTTAPTEIVLSGNVSEVTLGGATPVTEATVEAVGITNDQPVASTTSAAQGAFSLTVQTGGVPLDGYARLTKTGLRRTVVYPPAPLSASFAGLPAPMASQSTFGTLASLAGATQDDTTNGALLVLVTDCAGDAVDGAIVTATQGGTAVGTVIDLGELGQPGAFAVFNVPAGVTTVGATYDGQAFRSHDVKAFAASSAAPDGTITATLIQPGYADL